MAKTRLTRSHLGPNSKQFRWQLQGRADDLQFSKSPGTVAPPPRVETAAWGRRGAGQGLLFSQPSLPLCQGWPPLCRAQQLLIALIQDMAQQSSAARKVRW